MDKYYYFASELPLLAFAEETHERRESFLAEANKWMSGKDFAVLESADINDFYQNKNDTALLRKYKNFERSLREDLAAKRKPQAASGQHEISEILEPSTLEGSPLEVEKKLLRLRWNFIESCEKEHYFDLGFFILYFLKLQILQKLFIFDKEKGLSVFDGLCEAKI